MNSEIDCKELKVNSTVKEFDSLKTSNSKKTPVSSIPQLILSDSKKSSESDVENYDEFKLKSKVSEFDLKRRSGSSRNRPINSISKFILSDSSESDIESSTESKEQIHSKRRYSSKRSSSKKARVTSSSSNKSSEDIERMESMVKSPRSHKRSSSKRILIDADERLLSGGLRSKASSKDKSLPAQKLQSDYEMQLEEISKCLGVDIADTKLGKLQAIQLLQGMNLDEIQNIKNRILREKIYAAKKTSIELNYLDLNPDNLEFNLYKIPQLDRSAGLNVQDLGEYALNHELDIHKDDLGEVEDLVTDEVSTAIHNLQTSLEIVSAAAGITLTAADLSKGITHYRKLHKLKKKLKATDRKLIKVNREAEALVNGKNGNDKTLYPELQEEVLLRKKELEVRKQAIHNARKILKDKFQENITDAVFTGAPSIATLSGVIITKVGGKVVQATGEVAIGSIIGGLHVVEGGMGLIGDIIDFKDLKKEQKEVELIIYSTQDNKVSQLFSLVMTLKSDNLKHYQEKEIYLSMTDDVLNIVEGVAAIAGAAGAAGAHVIVAGAAGARVSLQLGNFLYNHRSDVKDILNRETPPAYVRAKVAKRLSAKHKRVRKSTHYLQEAIQENALIMEQGREAINDNIESFKQIEVLEPLFNEYDARVVNRLMIDRASAKVRGNAKGLSNDIRALNETEFMIFKKELIAQKILKPSLLHASRDTVITEIGRYVKSRAYRHSAP